MLIFSSENKPKTKQKTPPQNQTKPNQKASLPVGCPSFSSQTTVGKGRTSPGYSMEWRYTHATITGTVLWGAVAAQYPQSILWVNPVRQSQLVFNSTFLTGVLIFPPDPHLIWFINIRLFSRYVYKDYLLKCHLLQCWDWSFCSWVAHCCL